MVQPGHEDETGLIHHYNLDDITDLRVIEFVARVRYAKACELQDDIKNGLSKADPNVAYAEKSWASTDLYNARIDLDEAGMVSFINHRDMVRKTGYKLPDIREPKYQKQSKYINRNSDLHCSRDELAFMADEDAYSDSGENIYTCGTDWDK